MYVCLFFQILPVLSHLSDCPLLVFTSMLGWYPFHCAQFHCSYTLRLHMCVCLSTSRSLATHRVTFLAEILQIAIGVHHLSSVLVVGCVGACVYVCVSVCWAVDIICVCVWPKWQQNDNKDKTKMKMHHSRSAAGKCECVWMCVAMTVVRTPCRSHCHLKMWYFSSTRNLKFKTRKHQLVIFFTSERNWEKVLWP